MVLLGNLLLLGELEFDESEAAAMAQQAAIQGVAQDSSRQSGAVSRRQAGASLAEQFFERGQTVAALTELQKDYVAFEATRARKLAAESANHERMARLQRMILPTAEMDARAVGDGQALYAAAVLAVNSAVASAQPPALAVQQAAVATARALPQLAARAEAAAVAVSIRNNTFITESVSPYAAIG